MDAPSGSVLIKSPNPKVYKIKDTTYTEFINEKFCEMQELAYDY